MMSAQIELSDANRLDEMDPLAAFRSEFHLPDDIIYLDGNSLGAAPLAAFDEVDTAMREEWAENLITSWRGAGWWTLGETLGDRIAPLVGVNAGEVVVCDTTSINIFKALHAGISMRPGRTVVLTEARGFPTDSYVAEGVVSSYADIRLHLVDVESPDWTAALDESVAVVLVNHVDYRTAALRDMSAITEQIHAVGAIAVWDLCHSVGVVDVDLDAAGADFAVGCTYKYMNGGPGSPAFIYANAAHHGEFETPLQGWWGHADPFGMEPSYRGAAGVRRLLVGTQPILSMRALAASLEMYERANIEVIRHKSQSLTGLFIDLIDQECAGFDLEVVTPRDPIRRGSQVSVFHESGYAIMRALEAHHVHGGYREPGVMRFGLAPLYTTHVEVWEAVARLRRVLESGEWREGRFSATGAIS
jgi:kynureninase